MTEVTAYHNPNAPIERQWIAYVVMDNGKLWGVYAIGATQGAAEAKIQTLWESERAKISLSQNGTDCKPALKPAQPSLPSSWGETLTGKAPSAFKGMVWLINKATRAKARVSAEAAEMMMASGDWERGGPRSR